MTSRGLVVRDHRTGGFHGMPWAHFSIDDHLRQHSRHAVLTMWIGERRPVELAITRRLALNIVSIAPVLQLHPDVVVDDVVVAEPVTAPAADPVTAPTADPVTAPTADPVIDLRSGQSDPVTIGVGSVPLGYGRRSVSAPPPPTISDWYQAVPAPPMKDRIAPPPPAERQHRDQQQDDRQVSNRHALDNLLYLARTAERRRRAFRLSGVAMVLVLAGLVGTVASLIVNGNDDGALAGTERMLTSEAVDLD